MKDTVCPRLIQPYKFLWFLTLTYTMVIVFSNWYGAKLIQIFGFNADAGALIFPISFLLSCLITEVYGYKNARRVIWTGLLFNLLFISYSKFIIMLGSPAYAVEKNKLFDQLLDNHTRIIIASTVAYIISEMFNIYLLAKLKMKTCGKYLSIRFFISILLSTGLNRLLYGWIAFSDTMSVFLLMEWILGIWLIMLLVEVFGIAIVVRLSSKLKQIENLDIYDSNTNFNLFSLDTNYLMQANAFKLQSDEKDFLIQKEPS